MISYKNFLLIFVLLFITQLSLAGIPSVNRYSVEKRSFSSEPTSHQFSISIKDDALLELPVIESYTHLNPLKPNEVYSIHPYPDIKILPRLGKWMITSGNEQLKIKYTAPAHWIDLTNAKLQYIIEPINYVFIIYANDRNEAVTKFNLIANKIGFTGVASDDHTNGYSALIGKNYLSQLKNKSGLSLTFSTGDFRVQNDHFRAFGLYPLLINKKQAFIATGSVSEESGIKPEWVKLSFDKLKTLSKKIIEEDSKSGHPVNYGHRFVSFSNARNNLAVAFIQSGYPTYYAVLNNVVNTTIESTEDHDGNVYITIIN